MAVTVDLLRKNGQLQFDAMAVRENGEILAQGPEIVVGDPISAERARAWLSELEVFLAVNQHLLRREIATLR